MRVRRIAFEVWPNALVEGSTSQELPLPKDFEQLVEDRSAEELDDKLVLGDKVDDFIGEIRNSKRVGYTHLYVHQIGPDQDGFLKFAKSELFPRL